MVSKSFWLMSFATVMFLFASIGSQDAFGQGDAGGGGNVGGDIPTINPGDVTGGGNNGGGQNVGGGGDVNTGDTARDIPGLENFFDQFSEDIPEIEDTRSRPFVGERAEDLGGNLADSTTPLGFIGPTTEGMELSAPAGTPRALETGDPQNTGQSAQQNTTGFTYTRKNVRARLRSAIRVQPMDPSFISARFQNRMSEQTQTRDLSGEYFVEMDGSTAILSGFVKTQEEADRILGQLRLEPGVYKIVNDLRVQDAGSVSRVDRR